MVVAVARTKARARAQDDKAKVPGFVRRERLKRAKPEAPQTLARLSAMHPDAHCELDHANAFQLLCSTVLSAQTTDVAVNKITPALFAKYPDARAMAAADPLAIEELIARIGMFRQKARNLSGLAKKLVEAHDGDVPRTMDELVALPGVGRKTANVVMGVMWGAPDGVVVDTHVQRISQRLGWTKNADPPKIEQDLCKLLPKSEWDHASHVLIFHGRRVCFAIKPDCEGCKINDTCPSAFRAENIGRKPKRVRVVAVAPRKLAPKSGAKSKPAPKKKAQPR